MKHQLLKKISKIHSVKCNKSIDFKDAFISYIKLTELTKKIDEMNEENVKSVESINSEIETWTTSKPIVNESEI